MSMMLTTATVAKMKASKRRVEIRDLGCPGLYLIIQPSGHRSWAMRFRRPSGVSAKLTLGPADLTGQEPEGEPTVGMPLTLSSARQLAIGLCRQRAQGKDIVAIQHRAKLEHRARGGNSFAEAVVAFIEQHARAHNRMWERSAWTLGVRADDDGKLALIPRGLAERWQDRPVAEIDGDEVHAIVEECSERGIPGLERRADGTSESRGRQMHASLGRLFSWLLQRRRIKLNPCVGVARPKAPASRDRILTDADILKFWKAASSERAEFGAPLKLLLISGQRLKEVMQMGRSELSDDLTKWTIPSARTKNKREHVVPLSPLAREQVKDRLDARMKIPDWRFHDLRRTAATGMSEIGVPPHIVEAVLNHISGSKGGVAGTYNRAAYAAEKKAALERWSAHVMGLVEGRAAGNVVMMKKA